MVMDKYLSGVWNWTVAGMNNDGIVELHRICGTYSDILNFMKYNCLGYDSVQFESVDGKSIHGDDKYDFEIECVAVIDGEEVEGVCSLASHYTATEAVNEFTSYYPEATIKTVRRLTA